MRSAKGPSVTSHNLLTSLGIIVAVCFLLLAGVFGFYYTKYSRIVDERLKKPLFDNTAKIYAAPTEMRPGQKYTAKPIAQQLREAGYSVEGQGKTSGLGPYALSASSLTIRPGPQSFHEPD